MIYLQTRDTRSFILKLNKLLDAFDEMESPNTQIYIDIQGKNWLFFNIHLHVILQFAQIFEL